MLTGGFLNNLTNPNEPNFHQCQRAGVPPPEFHTCTGALRSLTGVLVRNEARKAIEQRIVISAYGFVADRVSAMAQKPSRPPSTVPKIRKTDFCIVVSTCERARVTAQFNIAAKRPQVKSILNSHIFLWMASLAR